MNVLIVDDEPIIRIGLRSLIDWEKHGFRLVGEASDGEEAMEILTDLRVDLLVTDIKMPRMDGLELIRNAKRVCEDIGIAVISCLDDFGFVKEAMKLGAKDYILKPTMEPDELVAVLQTIGAQLSEERREKSRIRELNDRLEQSMPYRLQAKLRSFFDTGAYDEELASELFKHGKKLFSMLVVMPSGLPHTLGEEEQREALTAVRLQDHHHLLLIGCDRSVSYNDWYQLAYQSAKKLLHAWTADANPIIYVAPPIGDLGELLRRPDYHRRQMTARYYSSAAGSICSDEPPSPSRESDPAMLGAARGHVLRAIAGGNLEAVRHSMSELLRAIGELKPELMRLHAFVFETIGLVIGYARENGYGGITDVEQQYLSAEAVSSRGSFAELSAFLTDFIQDICDGKSGIKMRQAVSHPFIRKAIAYIRDHYSRNIGTADIAEHVKLSRSYLSDLYSKETGESLTETLTRIRIEEACKLLLGTDKKIYEIAEEVGFNDSKTFTKTFKRLMGCSPKDFPASNK